MTDGWDSLSVEADDEPWWCDFGCDADNPPEWVEEYETDYEHEGV